MPDSKTLVTRVSNGNPWTTAELAYLRKNASLGAVTIAEALRRSVGSVKQAAHRAGISLRRPGSTRGLLLGQARGTKLRYMKKTKLEEMRKALANGTIDAVAVRRRLDEILAGRVDGALCSRCTRERAGKSGFCRPCHVEGLIEAYEREKTYADRTAEVWARYANVRKRSTRTTCSVDSCETLAWKDDLCRAHLREAGR
jgi:hypothetical protein